MIKNMKLAAISKDGIPIKDTINNIVDIANFAMFSNGHPLHVFDLSKVQGE